MQDMGCPFLSDQGNMQKSQVCQIRESLKNQAGSICNAGLKMLIHTCLHQSLQRWALVFRCIAGWTSFLSVLSQRTLETVLSIAKFRHLADRHFQNCFKWAVLG